ncbi:MAG: tRNA (guanine(26)-N(2))-dimethyltransferase [Aquificaceae bacterium]|nr:tRNA (guanine(26)-N(2))-dimethyltransferase [Aquificaceae bacterium]MCX8060540.1 tRNA (guanine(26)-N(2))-dimethyltransferase [Aquificaceae bacterium]MDW8096897.1 tRNA (guanine(26)-N(2))-dimethyltransferase [Aquificaceae bacterium]
MLREGKVLFELCVPQVVSSEMEVFYNPHMRENRDISLLVLLHLPFPKVKVCDPMGASGVRLLRMLLETDKVERALYNDLSQRAVDFFRALVRSYSLEDRVEVHSREASLFLRELRGIHYVDIDPFGSPVPFLEGGVLAVARRGVLAVSATDTSVLSGTYPSTCLRRYGSRPLLSAEFYHEVGLRILIKKVVEEGSKMDFAMRPIFSYSYRHYYRVFFQKELGAKRADALLQKVGYLLYCQRCLYRQGVQIEEIKRSCPHCGSSLLVAGPLWIGELWDTELVEELWERRGSVELSPTTLKLLRRIREESKLQTVGFYTVSAFGRALGVGQPPPVEKFLEVFEGVRTHFSGEGFRTALSHQEVLRRKDELLQRA